MDKISGHCKLTEYNRFLKKICSKIDETKVVYECANSEEFYYSVEFIYETTILRYTNSTCKNDPKSYQICGTLELNKMIFAATDQVLCGHIYCKKILLFRLYSAMSIYIMKPEARYKNNVEMCKLTESMSSTAILSTNVSSVPDTSLCNGLCDLWTCEDERLCNGYVYGLFCMQVYIKPENVCDGSLDCFLQLSGKQTNDENMCDDIISFPPQDVCTSSVTNKLVPIFNFTRCSSIKYSNLFNSWSVHLRKNYNCGNNICVPYCIDFKDQTNCTDIEKVALLCNIRGFLSSVSKVMVCSDEIIGVKMCDDGTDLQCINTSPSCRIHKHLICNGVMDCTDKTDETSDICSRMTKQVCSRKYVQASKLMLPLAWVSDGHIDCLNGRDENVQLWKRCGVGKIQRFVSEGTICFDVYICLNGPKNFIEFDKLCDRVESCGNEMCKITRNRPLVHAKLLTSNKRQISKTALHCLKGLKTLELLTKPCLEFSTDLLGIAILGYSPSILNLPVGTHDCRYMYGELYLYISCLGYCKSSDCPLSNREPLKHDSCPAQYQQRIYTLASNSALTFVVRKGSTYENDYFTCNNSYCIEYYKMCNLVDDCGDGSDEISCSNHFKCTTIEQYLPISQKCDARVDCIDFSDECNDECSKNILPGSFYKIVAWTIGCMATFLNSAALISNFAQLIVCKRFDQLMNKILIILISFGDLTVGIYLLVIAVIDSIFFKSAYCFRQFEWLTNQWCAYLGILSTFGSQLSIFSMAILSFQRALGIKRSLTSPESINRKRLVTLFLLVTLLLLSSVLVAVVPLIDYFEDYFVNGVIYDQSIRLFIGMVNKVTHSHALKAYYGRMRDKTLKWIRINEMMYNIFSHDYNLALGYKKNVHFYGNDGVCLFKYFVKKNDPQWSYTIVLLFLNFVLFLVISMCYTFIGLITVRATKILTKDPGPTGKIIKARNRKLQKRIAVIIGTDFICWVPFVAVCFLHFSDIIDATSMYSTFSIIVLPVNCVINPLLYDTNYLHGAVQKIILKCFTTINNP